MTKLIIVALLGWAVWAVAASALAQWLPTPVRGERENMERWQWTVGWFIAACYVAAAVYVAY